MTNYVQPLCLLILHIPACWSFQTAQAWQATVRITPQDSGTQATIRGLAVRNHAEAWVTGSGGTVIRTTDSGRTWKRIPIPESNALDFRDVEVLPDGTLLLMSIGSGNASRILRSSDSGNTWRTVLSNQDATGFFDGMTFHPDGLRGVLFGDPVKGRLDLYHTRDGGLTWSRAPAEQRPAVQKDEYGFAASGTGIALHGRHIWIATGGSIARIFHSADAGMSWTAHDTGIRSGTESSGIFSIAALDHKTVIAVGGDYVHPERDTGNVARSTDGGRTWKTLQTVRMPHKACVQSLGHGRLLTCGRTGVAFSDTAGQTWQPVTEKGYFTFAFDRRSGTGFLAGGDGRVARFTLSSGIPHSSETDGLTHCDGSSIPREFTGCRRSGDSP